MKYPFRFWKKALEELKVRGERSGVLGFLDGGVGTRIEMRQRIKELDTAHALCTGVWLLDREGSSYHDTNFDYMREVCNHWLL